MLSGGKVFASDLTEAIFVLLWRLSDSGVGGVVGEEAMCVSQRSLLCSQNLRTRRGRVGQSPGAQKALQPAAWLGSRGVSEQRVPLLPVDHLGTGFTEHPWEVGIPLRQSRCPWNRSFLLWWQQQEPGGTGCVSQCQAPEAGNNGALLSQRYGK